jgi:RND family efflux transporter MFP subunit
MRSLIFCCVAVVAIFSLSACGDNGSATPAATVNASAPASPAPSPAPAATSAPAVDAPLVVSGPIIVEHQVELTAQRDGTLEKIFVDAPSRVKAGALLAQMDGRQLQANLEAARAKSRSIEADLKNWQAEAEVLRSDYERQKNLWDLGLTSKEQLEHARYKAESDQWDIKRVQETLNTSHNEERSLELELEKAKITAPFGGLIARRYVHEGQTVAKGERLFWVTEESPLLLRFTLPERYFGHVHSAQQFDLTSPDAPGETHSAKVKEISPVVDPASGTFEVLVALIGDRGSLRPGMTASVKVPDPR